MENQYYCIRCLRRVNKPVDHRKPRGQGGSDDRINIQPLCNECHRWKHDHPKQAIEEGITLLRSDKEKAWWIDFPYALVGDPDKI